MTGHVLMNKKTGDLLLGYRICFLDQDWISDLQDKAPGAHQIVMLDHDGWVIEHPVSRVPWYFNRECEKWFIDLGEL